MSKYNLNNFKKVKYICEMKNGKKYYFRQEYLLENIQWGSPRPITERTFIKRKKDGFQVEYRQVNNYPNHIICKRKDLMTLIDISLQMNDKEWFLELTDRLNKL